MESLEQKIHYLEIKLKRTEEERNSVVNENEDLQNLLFTARESKGQCESKLLETKRDLFKLNDEIQRLDSLCISNSEAIHSIHDKLHDLYPLKSLLGQIREESSMVKEELHLLKCRYDATTKLELHTQEQLYESRLIHLESVLEEMKQGESQFLRLAEETNVLKDQVDYLRELSVNTMKTETEEDSFKNLPVKIYENRVLENELRNQFASLCHSFSNLRGFSSMERDMLLAATSSPEVEDILPFQSPLPTSAPITHEIVEPLKEIPHKDSSFNDMDNESGSGYLLVHGKIKINNIHRKNNGTTTTTTTGSNSMFRPITLQSLKQDKVNLLADIITKIWIVFFD
ncbi:uncharacterized protein [Lepeophtheirus salmonis]|nr:uncharacterized protein LOC121121230 isoform X2 [Lepeophtheirus salmonis]